MPFNEPLRAPCVESQIKHLKKKYPNAETAIDYFINDILANPYQGDQIPAIPGELRKARMALKDYKLGKSKGLRFIWMPNKENSILYLVNVYAKAEYKSEKKTTKKTKENLTEIIRLIK